MEVFNDGISLPHRFGVYVTERESFAAGVCGISATADRRVLQSVIKTVNDAPDGEWIDGSEEGVRDLAAEFRQRVFQAAVQGRVDAAEAAFSPSAGNNSRPGHETTGDENVS
jgi:hypothetical protein